MCKYVPIIQLSRPPLYHYCVIPAGWKSCGSLRSPAPHHYNRDAKPFLKPTDTFCSPKNLKNLVCRLGTRYCTINNNIILSTMIVLLVLLVLLWQHSFRRAGGAACGRQTHACSANLRIFNMRPARTTDRSIS